MYCLIRVLTLGVGFGLVWSSSGMMIKKGKQKNLKRTLLQFHYRHYECHVK
jgi:hypothetical protein